MNNKLLVKRSFTLVDLLAAIAAGGVATGLGGAVNKQLNPNSTQGQNLAAGVGATAGGIAGLGAPFAGNNVKLRLLQGLLGSAGGYTIGSQAGKAISPPKPGLGSNPHTGSKHASQLLDRLGVGMEDIMSKLNEMDPTARRAIIGALMGGGASTVYNNTVGTDDNSAKQRKRTILSMLAGGGLGAGSEHIENLVGQGRDMLRQNV
jgi:hypothetical protein